LALPAHREPLCLPPHTGNGAKENNAVFPENIVIPCADQKIQLSDNEEKQVPDSTDTITEGNSSLSVFCYHAGVMLFSPYFSGFQKEGLGFMLQWLVSILLGAKNIEQTKTLNFRSLNIILGQSIKSLTEQRLYIKKNATASIEKLLRFNIGVVGLGGRTDFYYDPHTKHYTGLRNILKGWCSKVRMGVKVINSDYMHTTDGHPVYFDIDDNYDDMRIRFFRQVDEFRRLANITLQQVTTMVVDRAIFSMEVFEKVLLSPYLHLITWEKNYKRDQWDKSAKTGHGFIERTRNNAQDRKLIKYSYQDKLWDKNKKVRQIIVRIAQPDNRGLVEVSILCDDLHRPATEVINLMFNRWVQENDFKYLIKHFGIDQITSYGFDDYQEIKDQLEDKEQINGEYLAINKTLESEQGKYKTVLYKLDKLERKEKNKKLTKKQQERKGELLGSQEKYRKSIDSLESERSNTEKKVSKIDALIKGKKQKLRKDTKRCMDTLKIIARNIFYKTFETFREDYNNYRDDLLICREVSRANAMVSQTKEGMVFKLSTVMELTPKIKKHMNTVIDKINQQEVKMPNTRKEKITIQIDNCNDSFFASTSK